MVLNVSLFRKRVLTDDQVKTRSLEWALTQYNWYHYKKKGEPGHETGLPEITQCESTGKLPSTTSQGSTA